MDDRAQLRRLLHDLQSKTASLKSAAQLLKDCPADQAREMVSLMIRETQDILRCLSDYQRLDPKGS